MTREEAIKELKELEYYGRFFDNSETENKKNKALFMAIEALEQKPCDDAISRQMVLEKAYKIAGYDRSAYVVDVADIEALPSVSCLENPNRCDDAVSKEYLKKDMIRYRWKHPDSTVTEYVDNLPSVSTKKTGRWIKNDTGHSIYYDCSLCGCSAPCTETADKILWKLANYCPGCGAKMENNGERWRLER